MKARIIEKEGRFYKECGVVILDTTNKAQIHSVVGKNKFTYSYKNDIMICAKKEMKRHHLYIISDDEIKEGDCILNINTHSIAQYNGCGSIDWWRKIIATTDTSLTENIEMLGTGSTYVFKLPQPSDKFLQAYIEAYNRGEKIDRVLVEYDRYFEGSSLGGEIIEYSYQPKLKDNKVIIKRVKDTWTRSEVIQIIDQYRKMAFGIDGGLTVNKMNQFISENI